jgi:hypothetical protein
MRLIDDISNAQQAVVTCTEDHDFIDNELVSLRVSKAYGMVEMNNKQAKVLSHTSDTITINVDSQNFTAFSIPGDLIGTTPPCVVPSASGVDLNSPVPRTILEDAFDNIP